MWGGVHFTLVAGEVCARQSWRTKMLGISSGKHDFPILLGIMLILITLVKRYSLKIVEVGVPKLSKGISNMLMLTELHQNQLRIVNRHRH